MILGGVAVALAALAVPAYQFETRYEMGQVSFPWQNTRRRLIAARALFDQDGPPLGQTITYVFDKQDAEERAAARARKNRETCDKLATASVDYVVRCVEADGAERERARAEMRDLIARALRYRIPACEKADGSVRGPADEAVVSCLRFLGSGSCEILDYKREDLAGGTLDYMVKKPGKPQPHLEACPFLFI